MTATDELRRLLNERGVNYEGETDEDGWAFTRWHGFDDTGWLAVSDEQCGLLDLRGRYLFTPAQAIAATLVAGTCEDLGGTDANGRDVFNCSGCGCVLSLYDIDGSNNLCTSFIFDYPRFCPECGARVVRP